MIADAYNTSDIVYWWAKDNVEIEKKTVAQFQNEEVHLSKTVEQYITGKYLFNLDQHLDARATLDDNSLFLLHKRSARFICETNVLLILLVITRPVHQIMMITTTTTTTTTITMTIRTMIVILMMMMMIMVMMITITITIKYLKHPRTPKPYNSVLRFGRTHDIRE